jgi:hypothetical protein
MQYLRECTKYFKLLSLLSMAYVIRHACNPRDPTNDDKRVDSQSRQTYVTGDTHIPGGLRACIVTVLLRQ